jgi:hypothetical protein
VRGRLLRIVIVAALLFEADVVAAAPGQSLIAQILDPPPGFKLRAGSVRDVRIIVASADTAEFSWSLSLRRVGGEDGVTIATGTAAVRDAAVAELVAHELAEGQAYVLELAASDKRGAASAQVRFRIVDPVYTLIPLDEGNLSRVSIRIFASDVAGDRLVYAGRNTDPAELILFDRAFHRKELILVPIGTSESFRLSGDGSRLFFISHFPGTLGLPEFGLGFLNLANRKSSLVDRNGDFLFSTDSAGRRIVYQGFASNRTYQYFFYDEVSGERRQLTDDPSAINRLAGGTDCPDVFGSRPLMSADGSKVVIITAATMGLVPGDDSVGCRVFTYDVAQRTWKHVASLPASTSLSSPTLSAGGRWLSFPVSRVLPNGISRAFAALVDLQSGEVRDPVVDVGNFTSFDSVITGDGRGIVISTQADLDPRVGNADHNLELFYYDFATAQFSQVSETTGGIGSRPGGCPTYRPFVSSDGGVVTFTFHRFSVEGCVLDGPMRNERDGFVFRFVHAVRKRPGNGGPLLAPLADQHLTTGETLKLDIRAQDPDGDFLSFFAQVKGGIDVPPGSVITDHHDGTATFEWPTRPEHAGAYVLRVAAFDEGGGEMFQDVTITVAGRDVTETPSPSATAPPASPTAVSTACLGDCDRDGQVTVGELITGTRIALGMEIATSCTAFHCDGAPAPTIACLTRAVLAALNGCP